ncbi:hypothetical protein LTR54_018394, partial [Friedmanniomyces endolithicus]
KADDTPDGEASGNSKKGDLESQEDGSQGFGHHSQRKPDHDRHGCHDDAIHEGHAGHDMSSHGGHQHGSTDRPMFATITVAVCHCGAGCVLGDIIGEWLVYGTGASINGRSLWCEYLIDFAFAIAFGIVFQYFSIAPMVGEYGPKTLWRSAKADFLSLMFFEIGLFGWMAIFQIAVFKWRLEMDTVTYWWMMQVSLILHPYLRVRNFLLKQR